MSLRPDYLASEQYFSWIAEWTVFKHQTFSFRSITYQLPKMECVFRSPSKSLT